MRRTGGGTREHAGPRILRAAAVVALLSPLAPATCGPRSADAKPTPLDRATAAALPLSAVQQKATHNSYAKDERLVEQIAVHAVRGVEIDVHASRRGAAAQAGDWFVYHVDLPGLRGTNCPTLSTCLEELGAFHRASPRHDLLALFVDMKDAFAPGHEPSDLDARLEQAFGASSLYRPADALARCPGPGGVGAAVDRCGWPTVGELAGRVLVAVTGGTACSDGTAAAYARRGASGSAFAAPNLDGSCPLDATAKAAPDVAFANLRFEERGRVEAARARGWLTRIYYGGLVGGLDDEASWAAAARSGAAYLATDAVDAPWATTAGGDGLAFRRTGGAP